MSTYEVTLGVDMKVSADSAEEARVVAKKLLYDKLGPHGRYDRDHLIGSWSHHSVWKEVLRDVIETEGIRLVEDE